MILSEPQRNARPRSIKDGDREDVRALVAPPFPSSHVCRSFCRRLLQTCMILLLCLVVTRATSALLHTQLIRSFPTCGLIATSTRPWMSYITISEQLHCLMYAGREADKSAASTSLAPGPLCETQLSSPLVHALQPAPVYDPARSTSSNPSGSWDFMLSVIPSREGSPFAVPAFPQPPCASPDDPGAILGASSFNDLSSILASPGADLDYPGLYPNLNNGVDASLGFQYHGSSIYDASPPPIPHLCTDDNSLSTNLTLPMSMIYSPSIPVDAASPAASDTPSSTSSAGSQSEGRRSPSQRPSSTRPQKVKPYRAPQRRNVIVDPSARAAMAAERSASDTPRDKYECPYCNYVQKSRRKPDLDRHIETHFAENKHVCRGVPASEADAYGVSAELRDGSEWVGGCGATFSRRDALLRHLRTYECYTL